MAVLETIQAAYLGVTVAQTYDGAGVFDVSVVLDSSLRQDAGTLAQLWIRNGEGPQLPLRELARIQPGSGCFLIEHEGMIRRRLVSCNVVDRDLVSFATEIKRRLRSELTLPPTISISSGGGAEAQAHAVRELTIHSFVAAAAIALILSLVFANARNMLLVLTNLPLALAGGALAVVVTGGSLPIGSLVGFISLFGISARNSILLVSHYEHLVNADRVAWNLETAIRGASERLVPILMTALVVALGLLPLAIQAHEAGKEIEGPMAIVILGGLVTSTVLNLLVLPALALRYWRFPMPGATAEPTNDDAARRFSTQREVQGVLTGFDQK